MKSRLARALLRSSLTLAVVPAVLAAAGWAVLSQPQFGAPMAGARLAVPWPKPLPDACCPGSTATGPSPYQSAEPSEIETGDTAR